MAIKVIVAACLLAVVSAQYPPPPKYAPAPKYAPPPPPPAYPKPAPYAPKYAPEPEPYDHPKYAFDYAVHDDHTYDIKSQKEERDGDYVKGSYELYDPDGTKRIVEYSDEGHGFVAVVHKVPGKAYAPAPAYKPAPAYPAPAYPVPAYPAPAPVYPAPAPYKPAPAPYKPAYPAPPKY